MQLNFPELQTSSLLALVFIFIFSGFVKGAIGFGLPLVALPLASLLISVQLLVVTLPLSVLLSSIQMAVSGGNVILRLKEQRLLSVSLIFGVLVGVSFLTRIPDAVFYFLLGVITLFFTIFSWIGNLDKIFTRNKTALDVFIGGIVGAIGGVSSAFGPLLAAYFSANKMPKNQLVQTVNLLLALGSAISILAFGIFQTQGRNYIFLSVIIAIPVMTGVWIGEALRKRIPEHKFKLILQIALIALAINLMRRAFF